MVRKYLILLLVVVFSFYGSIAQAQVQENDVVLDISPQYPSPNKDVTATLSSYSTNLDKAYISWSINSQQRSAEIGRKVFYFTMGDLGSSLNLTATINTIDGQIFQKTLLVTPTTVDLLWEAPDSSTPPFYRGKALAPSQGAFRVVAVPNLTNQSGRINTSNLSYTWSKDGNVQPDSSGWGRSSLLFQNSYLDKGNVITVKVSDITGANNASGAINLETSNPKIIFYSRDQLLGIRWENALTDGFIVNPNGETLVAQPYFFSPRNINSANLAFNWYLNGEKIQTPSPKNILSVKPEDGRSGNSVIKLIVENTRTLFQNTERIINVNY